MRMLKKAAVILAVCLMIPVLSMLVFAADGVLMFSDPTAKVGDNVSVDLVVKSGGGTIGNVTVTMNYDTSAMEFVSGNGFTADGSGVLSYAGTGTGSELRSTMTFRALRQTDTQLTVSNSSAVLSSGETLNLDEGSSAISIAAADDGTTSIEPSGMTTEIEPSTGITVTVNGTEYNFSEAFTKSDIPEGYSETMLTFNGEERKFISSEGGVFLGYLIDDAGIGKFFLFNSADATFLPFAQITISDTTALIPLDKEDLVTLPEDYEKSTMTVQGYDFPAWYNVTEDDRFYVFYALNTRTNAEGLYQYDREDETYQYLELTDDTQVETPSDTQSKFGQFVSENAMLIFVIAVVICLLLLILMIVFAVKLVHRNQELDDLYDEYDIPFDDEEEASSDTPVGKSGKKDDDPDDKEYDDEEYDDEYDDAEYGDEEYDEYDDENDDNEYDDDDQGKKDEKDEDYDINFIDV